MRISLLQILLLTCFLSASFAKEGYTQGVLDQKISIKIENRPIKAVFQEIERKSSVRFIYSSNLINSNRTVNAVYSNKSIASILNTILPELKLSYTVSGKQIVIKRADSKSLGENKTPILLNTIKGKVTDENGDGLPGVSVVLKGTNTATISDASGNYEIETPDNEGILVFSFVGYLSKDVEINNRSQINVSLAVSEEALNEIVVIGYGTVKKSDLTGSVSSISSEKLTSVNSVSNIAHALQGQAAGVQVQQRSGQPGENVSIIIRGNNSIQANNAPLYVVDGLPLDGLTGQLNPSDIENIEVLKDASSTAIYGSRGANGVILITTKKGKAGQSRITYDGYYGVQTLRKKIDLIGARDYATLQNEVNENYNLDNPTLPQRKLWNASQIDSLSANEIDWQDLIYRTAPVQSHDISTSGGLNKTRYYTSIGYFNQQGIIRNSGFERFSFRGNMDIEHTKRLSSSVSLSLQRSTYNQNNYFSADGGGGVPFTTMVMPPTQGVYDANGKYTIFRGVPWGQTNPYGMSTEQVRNNNALRVLGNVKLIYKITDDLNFRVSGGVDNSWGVDNYFAPSTLSIAVNGAASKNYSNSSTFVNENILNYNKSFGKNVLDLLGGFTFQTSQSAGLNSGTFSNFLTDLYGNNNLAAATVKPTNTNSYLVDYKLISYLGRVNYSYDDRYFLTLTGRYDGSSRFSKNSKFAFFPSSAFAWRISNEKFMENVKDISSLKLRASYGIVGNQAIESYQTLGQLSNTNVTLDNLNTTAYYLSRLENSNLKWESTSQLDVGIDVGLFNERIQFTADYYDKKTRDLLLNVDLPTSSGFTSSLQNVGKVGNKGFEFLLSGNVIRRNAFKWNTTLTYSANRTKVLDLGKDAQGNPIVFKTVGTGGNWFPLILGQPMQQLFGVKVLGVYESKEEAIQNGEPTKVAGDYKFQTTPGGVLPNDNRVILSNFQPKFTFGFNNDFTYKNFDLSLLFTGSVGNDIANEFRKYNITLNGNWTPTKEAFEGRWGNGTGEFERPSVNSGSSIRDYANSLWIENGSYVRLRNITLGYNFDAGVLSKINVSSLRLYISGQNLLTLTKYSGYDPEASWDNPGITPRIVGWDRGVYPSSKSITGGIKVEF